MLIIFLYLLWVLKRTVSLSTYNLPMIWLDLHLYEKGSFYAHTLPATEGGFQWRGGEGVLFLVRIRRRWSWAELATGSLEGLDIFYVHIT